MASIAAPHPTVTQVDDTIYTRCEICEGRIDADVYPYLSAWDYWCVCPLAPKGTYSPHLGEPFADESGLTCWYSADGTKILKPYPRGEAPETPLSTIQAPDGSPLFVWPNVALEPPTEGRKITVQEQAARYREIKRILWSIGMPMAEKIALLEAYEMTGLYPGTIQAGGSIEATSLNMGALSKRMGCSADRAGRAVQHLANTGLLVRQERHEPVTGHKIVSVAPARRLGFDEVLPEAERKVQDRDRKRCKHCGSPRVETRHICHTCGSVEIIPIPLDRDLDICHSATPPVESTVGPIHENTDNYREEPPVDSTVGPGIVAQPINDRKIYTVAPRIPVASKPLPSSVQPPSNRNRPYWACPHCHKIMWSSAGTPRWSCENCGSDPGPEPAYPHSMGQKPTPPRFDAQWAAQEPTGASSSGYDKGPARSSALVGDDQRQGSQ